MSGPPSAATNRPTARSVATPDGASRQSFDDLLARWRPVFAAVGEGALQRELDAG